MTFGLRERLSGIIYSLPDPAGLDESADMSGMHAMPNNPEFAFGLPGCFSANSAMTGMNNVYILLWPQARWQ